MNKLPKMSGVPPVIVSALVEVEEWGCHHEQGSSHYNK